MGDDEAIFMGKKHGCFLACFGRLKDIFGAETSSHRSVSKTS